VAFANELRLPCTVQPLNGRRGGPVALAGMRRVLSEFVKEDL
jgi:hypothetical protein